MFILFLDSRVSTSWLFQRTLWTVTKERCRRDTCVSIQNAFTSRLKTGARGASGRVLAWFTEHPARLPHSWLFLTLSHREISTPLWTQDLSSDEKEGTKCHFSESYAFIVNIHYILWNLKKNKLSDGDKKTGWLWCHPIHLPWERPCLRPAVS